MSSDSDDALNNSSDGGDTDELIEASKKRSIVKKKPAPKRRLQKKNAKKINIPDADNDSDDGENGLFDSDDDSDASDDGERRQKPAKRVLKKGPSSKKPMSKRERMELLSRAKRGDTSSSKQSKGEGGEKKSGYDSGDSYDSGTYVRTKEDDDFIDFDGEDEEAKKEYYREEHFEDERAVGEYSDDESGKKKSRAKTSKASKKRTSSKFDGVDMTDPDNPVTQALNRMKKKKKTAVSSEANDAAAAEFIRSMERAAEEDDRAIKERKPATKKLMMLSSVVDMLNQKTMVRVLLEHDLLVVVKRWIQPLPNGTLGNVTLRQKLVDAVAKMGTGEDGIQMQDLKRSDFGKMIMSLFMHKKETPTMKRKLKGMIEEYSREVFGRNGNMKDLHNAQSYQRTNIGLAGISRARAIEDAASVKYSQNEASRRKSKGKDLGSIMSKGTKASAGSGKSRVSVPYSKGFQFTVRPEDKKGDVSDRKNRAIKGNRQDLHKRIIDRSRGGNSKNSMGGGNLSIEGRATK